MSGSLRHEHDQLVRYIVGLLFNSLSRVFCGQGLGREHSPRHDINAAPLQCKRFPAGVPHAGLPLLDMLLPLCFCGHPLADITGLLLVLAYFHCLAPALDVVAQAYCRVK